MSVVFKSPVGWYISHSDLIKTYYKEISNSNRCFYLKPQLFEITVPYKQTKKPNKQHDYCYNNHEFEMEVRHVEELYCRFRNELPLELFNNQKKQSNEEALNAASLIYNESNGNFPTSLNGGNNGNEAIIQQLDNSTFLFPRNCQFFSQDVGEISKYLTETFDLILLDPPWWNKCIRRRKRKHSNQGYNMMYDDDLKQLPIERYLNKNGLVAVWCTNSSQHLNSLINEIFSKWGIKFLGKWYWVKVTTNFEPICEFSKPPRKQPFEQIIFGCRDCRKYRKPDCDRLVISVPSSIHSHKPPLTELLKNYLPENPKCLELFARYLLPNWTSYGREVLRLQHESLYNKFVKD